MGRRETLVVVGDQNTTVPVGRDTDEWGNVIGWHGKKVGNKSERLLSFCVVNDMLMHIVST